MVNAGARSTHVKCFLTEVPGTYPVQNIEAPLTMPAQQVCLGDENRALALITATSAFQAVERVLVRWHAVPLACLYSAGNAPQNPHQNAEYTM